MRVELNLKFDELDLPIHYNHILQAVIYKWINDENYSRFLHDKGYEYNKRRYKLFTFSRLEGKYKLDIQNKRIKYFEGAKLLISSLDDEFLKYAVENYIEKGSINIFGKEIEIERICYIFPELDNVKFISKSPITVYSTFERDGKKKTYYYNPMEEDFEELVRRNLIYKYKSFYGKDPDDIKFSIKPVKNTLKESIVLYKNTVIKGWNGEFVIEGSKELLKVAYGAGIGSKNSQGFGCIEVL